MPIERAAVIYSCPFVPPEWIEAHGLTPLRVAPQTSNSSGGSTPGICPYAHAFAGCAASSKAAAVIVTTACDQMRRAADIISRSSSIALFLMNVPHTWQPPSARKLYKAELERLGRFLVSLRGNTPSQEYLADIMLRYDSERNAMRNARKQTSVGVPIALIGGPLTADSSLFSLIERAGGYIALDGTQTGERTQPSPFDRKRLQDDPMGVLADSYFGAIADPFRRPNSGFYNWLKRSLAERNIRGLILRRYVWCDTWHAEAERIKEWAGLPFLHLDVGEGSSDEERTLSRLQSFMEMLI